MQAEGRAVAGDREVKVAVGNVLCGSRRPGHWPGLCSFSAASPWVSPPTLFPLSPQWLPGWGWVQSQEVLSSEALSSPPVPEPCGFEGSEDIRGKFCRIR